MADGLGFGLNPAEWNFVKDFVMTAVSLGIGVFFARKVESIVKEHARTLSDFAASQRDCSAAQAKLTQAITDCTGRRHGA